jgi:hypothetical protein
MIWDGLSHSNIPRLPLVSFRIDQQSPATSSLRGGVEETRSLSSNKSVDGIIKALSMPPLPTPVVTSGVPKIPSAPAIPGAPGLSAPTFPSFTFGVNVPPGVTLFSGPFEVVNPFGKITIPGAPAIPGLPVANP